MQVCRLCRSVCVCRSFLRLKVLTRLRVYGAKIISKKYYRVKLALSSKIKTAHIEIYNIHLLERQNFQIVQSFFGINHCKNSLGRT